MPFFLFGPSYDSWALGNEAWTTWSNLDPSLKKLFEDGTINGDSIDWVSSGAKGQIYVPFFPKVMGYGGLMVNKYSGASSVYRTQDPTLLADTNPVQLDRWAFQTRTVEHISFSSGGGWIVAYNDGTLRVSMTGTFPESFHSDAAPYLATKGCMNPQESAIKYVFFGAGDTFMMQMKDGRVIAHAIPPGLNQAVITRNNQGLMLGKSTALCPWDSRFFFACFEPMKHWSVTSHSYFWNIWPNGCLSDIVIREILEGVVPASIKAVTPFNEPPPAIGGQDKPRPATAPKGKPLVAPKPKPSKAIPLVSDGVKKNPFSIPDPRAYFSKEQIEMFKNWFCEMQTSPESGKADTKSVARFLTTYAEKIGDVAVSRLKRIWNKVDRDNSGDLDLEEFMHAMVLLGRLKIGLDLEDNSTALQVTNTKEEHADVPVDPPPTYSTSAALADTNGPAVIDTREVNNVLFCDICCATITDLAYSCTICDDWDMCQRCRNSGRDCPGFHVQCMLTKIRLEQNLEDQLSSISLGGKKPGQNNPKSSGGNNGDSSNRETDDAQLKNSLMSRIITEKPNVKWDDVAGLESAKQELQSAVVLPIKFPELFKGQHKQRRGMLLYGPPGTGKSFLAKAIATEVDATLFSISSSDVMSKWLGDSERLIKQLFQLAREKKPSIIFIDEIDALCGSRDAPGANPHMLGLKTELLVQMDGVGNDNEGVLLLGATNLPWTLDPAVRRRFQRKIHIPLPGEKARRQLFKISAQKMEVTLSKADYIELASMTDGCSGSDISNALQDALDVPIKMVQSANYYRKVTHDGKELFTPCKEGDSGAVKMTFIDVPRGKLKAPIVQREDVFAVLRDVKASVSQEEIKKYDEWTKQFGSEGA